MTRDVETQLKAITDVLVNELISLTPESMSEIRFEITATPDGGADIGLLEDHPDAAKVVLSDTVYRCGSQYLSLIRQYVPNWKRSLLVIRESNDGTWNVTIDYERT